MWTRGLLGCVAWVALGVYAAPAHADDAETLRKTVTQLQGDLAALRTAHATTMEEHARLTLAHAKLRQRHDVLAKDALTRRRTRTGAGHAPMGVRKAPRPPTRIAIDHLPGILKSLVSPSEAAKEMSVPGHLHLPSLRKLLMSESGAIADAAVHLADGLRVTDKAVRALVAGRNIEAGRAQVSELNATANDTLPLMLRRLAASSRLPTNFEASMTTIITAADAATVRSHLAAIESAGRKGFGDARPDAVRIIWTRLHALAAEKK